MVEIISSASRSELGTSCTEKMGRYITLDGVAASRTLLPIVRPQILLEIFRKYGIDILPELS